MADITMCSGVRCPISHKCYRHNAKPDHVFQSYFVTPPYKDGKCAELWLMSGESDKSGKTDAIEKIAEAVVKWVIPCEHCPCKCNTYSLPKEEECISNLHTWLKKVVEDDGQNNHDL